MVNNLPSIPSEVGPAKVSGKIKVMIVDDHPIMRNAIKSQLQNQLDMQVIAEASDGEEAIKLALELIPDVIIMDIGLPNLNGIEATRQITSQLPDIAILALTVYNDQEYILSILEAGAAGYLTKKVSEEELTQSIRSVARGESVLSKEVLRQLLRHTLQNPIKPVPTVNTDNLRARELEILKLMSKGLSNKEIANSLQLNVRTVKGYVESIFAKLHAGSRTEASIIGLRIGLISLKELE